MNGYLNNLARQIALEIALRTTWSQRASLIERGSPPRASRGRGPRSRRFGRRRSSRNLATMIGSSVVRQLGRLPKPDTGTERSYAVNGIVQDVVGSLTTGKGRGAHWAANPSNRNLTDLDTEKIAHGVLDRLQELAEQHGNMHDIIVDGIAEKIPLPIVTGTPDDRSEFTREIARSIAEAIQDQEDSKNGKLDSAEPQEEPDKGKVALAKKKKADTKKSAAKKATNKKAASTKAAGKKAASTKAAGKKAATKKADAKKSTAKQRKKA